MSLAAVSPATLAEAVRSDSTGRRPVEDQGVWQLSNHEMDWLLDEKFGMFIHWGLYAGRGHGEWMMHAEAIPPEQYRRFAFDKSSDEYFAADQYDPAAWASLAKQAGMRWMCLTARHHDGFCLFNSPHPNAFSSQQSHGRDFVAEYVPACRAAGLRVGLYFSPINWRYPGYYDVTGTDCKPNPFGYKTDPAHKENARLMKEENYANVHWLMTQYGKIDHIFWDGGWLGEQGTDADAAYFHEPGLHMSPDNPWPVDPKYVEFDANHRALGIMGVTRRHQPKVVVNPRYGWIGDYKDEEGGSEVNGPIRSKDIYQKCMTTAGAWGYDRAAIENGHVIKPEAIVEMLVNCVVRGMVLLLNVGPDRHGVIPPEVAASLSAVGAWLSKAGDGIYNTRSGPWPPEDRRIGFCSHKNRVFVHLMKDLQGSEFSVPAGPYRPLAARDLITGANLTWESHGDKILFQGMPPGQMPNRVAVIEFDRPMG
jgi:alpha-L-fucosidase